MRTTELTARPPLRLRLRTSEWERHTRARGLSSDAACAELLGLSRSTISRARNNTVEPSEDLIKAALWHLPGVRFEELFEVVVEPKTAGERG